MAKRMTLQVQKREERGKGPNRQLRQAGFVPGVFYFQGENEPVKVPLLSLEKAVQAVGLSQLLDLQIETAAPKAVLIKEYVRHPYKNRIEHVDFCGVDMDKPVCVQVPVTTTGKAAGVEIGGTLVLFRDMLTVQCMPHNIPEEICINVTKLALGEKLSVEALELPEGVEVLYDDSFAVVGVSSKGVSAGEEGEEDEAEAVEA